MGRRDGYMAEWHRDESETESLIMAAQEKTIRTNVIKVRIDRTQEEFWDVPVYAEYNHVKANRVDAWFVGHKSKNVMAVEMSCPWINNREKKDEEKTLKYGPLRWELKQQFPGYRFEQYNVIIDVVGGWSRDLDTTMRKMLGPRGRDVLLRCRVQ